MRQDNRFTAALKWPNDFRSCERNGDLRASSLPKAPVFPSVLPVELASLISCESTKFSHQLTTNLNNQPRKFYAFPAAFLLMVAKRVFFSGKTRKKFPDIRNCNFIKIQKNSDCLRSQEISGILFGIIEQSVTVAFTIHKAPRHSLTGMSINQTQSSFLSHLAQGDPHGYCPESRYLQAR